MKIERVKEIEKSLHENRTCKGKSKNLYTKTERVMGFSTRETRKY